MKKKIFAILALALIVSTASVFATGIGAQAGYVAGSGGLGGALTFKLNSAPWVFALDVSGINTNYLGFGLTADNWLANKTIAKPFAVFYGWGLAGSFVASGDYASIFAGARLVGGFNCFLAKTFELYVQGAWQPGIWISTAGGINPVITSFPVNFGFRFWF